MKNGILITLIALIVMSACSNFKEKADLIVLNGKVYTVNEKFDTVQAFAIKEGKFIATGSNKNILNHFQSPEVFDAQGKPVYPGFNDAHCHFFSYGYGLLKRIDLVGTKSYKEVIEKLKVHHKKYNTEWIEGRGWDQNDWEDQKFPTKKSAR